MVSLSNHTQTEIQTMRMLFEKVTAASLPTEVSTNCPTHKIKMCQFKNGEWKAWVDNAAFFADTMPRADLIRHLESQFPFTHKNG